jgi:hypothetical protein
MALHEIKMVHQVFKGGRNKQTEQLEMHSNQLEKVLAKTEQTDAISMVTTHGVQWA